MIIHEIDKFNPGSEFYNLKEQLKGYVRKRSYSAFEKGDIIRDSISCTEELEKHVKNTRHEFISAIGGIPSSESPLNPIITGVNKCKGFKIEKVIFESRPKTYITANLYIPDAISSPRGAVLFLCGHSKQAKQEEEYQIVCQYLVNAGLIVLAQDPIGQGERLSYYEECIGGSTVDWGIWEHTYAGIQSLLIGDSITRYFVHDAMRGIDYLCSRPEVDCMRIGVTGNSGGGTQTSLLMLCDTRIAAAAPGTFITNRRSWLDTDKAQDLEQIWPKMSALGFDHEDILLMMSPKPVLILAAQYDFFPVEGTRRSFERVKRFWEMYGLEEDINMFEDACDHAYTESMAKKAAEFFSTHLLGAKSLASVFRTKPLNPSLLRCTVNGVVRSDIPGARAVYEENCDSLSQINSGLMNLTDDQRRKRAYEWLKGRVFAGREPCDPNPRRSRTWQYNGLTVEANIWWTQSGLLNNAFLFRDYRFAGAELPVTIAVWDGGTNNIPHHIDWIRKTCNSGRALMVLDVSGEGRLLPDAGNDGLTPRSFFGPIYRAATDLIWLDDSLAAVRTYDVIRAVDMVFIWNGLEKEDIRVFGSGKEAVYTQFAAFLDDRIKENEVEHQIESFADIVMSRHYDDYDALSIIMPGMLNYFDIRDLNRWIGGQAI